jgi:hypothetical protein
MSPGHLNLLLYQVKIIEEPFGRGSDAPVWIHCGSRPVEGPEPQLVFIQLGKQPAGPVLSRDPVIARQDAGVARKLLGAE